MPDFYLGAQQPFEFIASHQSDLQLPTNLGTSQICWHLIKTMGSILAEITFSAVYWVKFLLQLATNLSASDWSQIQSG